MARIVLIPANTPQAQPAYVVLQMGGDVSQVSRSASAASVGWTGWTARHSAPTPGLACRRRATRHSSGASYSGGPRTV